MVDLRRGLLVWHVACSGMEAQSSKRHDDPRLRSISGFVNAVHAEPFTVLG